MQQRKNETDCVEITRQFSQSRQVVFSAFSQSAALESWLSPRINEVKPTVELFEFKVGGSFRIRYRMPNKVDSFLIGTYKTILEPELLIFTWIWEPPDQHANVKSLVTVKLNDAPSSGTIMVLKHTKLSATGMQSRHSSGWYESLVNLENYLNQQSNT